MCFYGVQTEDMLFIPCRLTTAFIAKRKSELLSLLKFIITIIIFILITTWITHKKSTEITKRSKLTKIQSTGTQKKKLTLESHEALSKSLMQYLALNSCLFMAL